MKERANTNTPVTTPTSAEAICAPHLFGPSVPSPLTVASPVFSLAGSLLNWAVANGLKAKDLELLPDGRVRCLLPAESVFGYGTYSQYGMGDYNSGYCPSSDWGHGGQLIHKYGIEIAPLNKEYTSWRAVIFKDAESRDFAEFQLGGTPLEAAMRCLVAFLSGPVVATPALTLAPATVP